jgi:hypothetical protein
MSEAKIKKTRSTEDVTAGYICLGTVGINKCSSCREFFELITVVLVLG